MKRNLYVVTSIVLVAAIAGLCGCSCGTALSELPSNLELDLNTQEHGIWVSGEGEVTVTPDIANLRLGISAQESSVAEAKEQAAEAMSDVMTALEDNGIAENDIQTEQFSIYPLYDWDDFDKEDMIIGYQVTNMVTAKIRDIDNVGAIIDAVAEAGGDLTRIDSINFEIDEPSAYYDEAREIAMADAKAKAESLSNLARVELGKPTYISESSYSPSPYYPRALYDYEEEMAGTGIQTEISPGEIDIRITVQVCYAIVQ